MYKSLGLLVLGALAAVMGVLHAFDVLLYLGVVTGALPGESVFFGVSWIGAILTALIAWIWFSAAGGLWKGDPQAWYFIVMVSILTLLFDTIAMAAGAPWVARAPSIVLAAFALIVALLPTTRQAITPARGT